jgi:hypothetical protein
VVPAVVSPGRVAAGAPGTVDPGVVATGVVVTGAGATGVVVTGPGVTGAGVMTPGAVGVPAPGLVTGNAGVVAGVVGVTAGVRGAITPVVGVAIGAVGVWGASAGGVTTTAARCRKYEEESKKLPTGAGVVRSSQVSRLSRGPDGRGLVRRESQPGKRFIGATSVRTPWSASGCHGFGLVGCGDPLGPRLRADPPADGVGLSGANSLPAPRPDRCAAT